MIAVWVNELSTGGVDGRQHLPDLYSPLAPPISAGCKLSASFGFRLGRDRRFPAACSGSAGYSAYLRACPVVLTERITICNTATPSGSSLYDTTHQCCPQHPTLIPSVARAPSSPPRVTVCPFLRTTQGSRHDQAHRVCLPLSKHPRSAHAAPLPTRPISASLGNVNAVSRQRTEFWGAMTYASQPSPHRYQADSNLPSSIPNQTAIWDPVSNRGNVAIDQSVRPRSL